MQEHLIIEVLKKVREHYSRKDLAEILGLTVNQVSDAAAGRTALPFVAALKLAELINVDPLPLLCANEHLLEKNPEKREYLEPFFANTETAHNLYLRQLTERLKYASQSDSKNSRCQEGIKEVLQGAEYFKALNKAYPRIEGGRRFDWVSKQSLWALRPIPRFAKFSEPEEAPRSREGWKNSTQKKEKARA